MRESLFRGKRIERGELVEVPKGAVVLTPEEREEEMRLCNEERKQAVKEFAEKLKAKRFNKDLFNDFAGATYVVLVKDIDGLVKKVCGE